MEQRSWKKEFTAVFNNQLVAAGQGKAKPVGAQDPQSIVLGPTDIHGGKRAATIGAAVLAAFQIANGVIQQQDPPFHPVAPEGDLEDRIFLVRVRVLDYN